MSKRTRFRDDTATTYWLGASRPRRRGDRIACVLLRCMSPQLALMRPTGRLGRCLFIEVKLTHREHSRHYRVWTSPGSVVKADLRMRATVEWLQTWPPR